MKPLWKSLPLLAVLLFTVVQADGEEIIADTHFNKKPNSWLLFPPKCHPFQILPIWISPRSNEDKNRTSKFLPPSPISVKSNRVQLRAIRSEIAAHIMFPQFQLAPQSYPTITTVRFRTTLFTIQILGSSPQWNRTRFDQLSDSRVSWYRISSESPNFAPPYIHCNT